MKKLITQTLSLWLVLLIVSSFVSPYSLEANSGYTFYTRITNINLPPSLNFYGYHPNQTFFEFEGTAEFINIYGETLTITTSTTCLVFYNCDLSFENESFSGSVWGPDLCGSAITSHTFEPGITEGYISFELSVNETLENLPNGNFTVWLRLDDCFEEHNYIHYKSTIAVNDSNITVTHEGEDVIFTFPTVSDFPIRIPYFLVVLLVGIPVIVLLRKRFLMV